MLTTHRNKLELTWVGKDDRQRPEPRILVEDQKLSYHADYSYGDADQFDNRLIFGDNLLALKALEQEFAGKVKCVFIDPPYNTGSAFTHYDDGVEHSLWLSLMRDRLELLRSLLTEDGSIWITLDDNEAHYMKVICDEIFGRTNFVANVIWEKSDSPRMDAHFFSTRHDHILVYAKNASLLRLNKIVDITLPSHYDKVSKDGRPYYLKPLRAMGSADTRAARPTLFFELIAPDGGRIFPVKQDGTDGRWRWSKEKIEQEAKRIEWVKGRNGWTPYYRIYGDTSTGRPAETVWAHADVGSNRTSKAEIKAIFSGIEAFDTPKPERLLQRVIHLATNPGDLVLDSFSGSGTTGAVAHKMGRRWIMVELGEHCHTHIIPRLKKVINGADAGGITEAVGWKGGGGFRYFKLAPSLLTRDKWDNWIINKDYKAEMLAEAVCKHEGFRYDPSSTVYWQHGQSTEYDFIYVTTQTLTHEQLMVLSDEVGETRTLLICCSAWRTDVSHFPNLTLKKIPQAVLHRCEFGKDDYSLNVTNLPPMPTLDIEQEIEVTRERPRAVKPLFENEAAEQ